MVEFYDLTTWGPGGPTRWDRAKHYARRAATSYRTVLVAGAAAVFLHIRWFIVDKAAGVEVVSGFGASLVVLGVWVAAFPFIRRGLVPRGPRPLRARDVVSQEFLGMIDKREEQEERTRLRRDQVDERIWGVLIVLLGTLLNGYGPLVARLLHLRGS